MNRVQAAQMLGIGRRGSRANLCANVAIVVVIAGLTDALIRALGWNQPPGEIWPDFAPRGGTIGLIWIVLFGGMGAARWLVAQRSGAAAHADLIIGLIALCLAYPFYTHFLHGHLTELVGNIGSLAFAGFVMLRIWPDSPVAAALIALVAAWMIFATVLVLALVQLNGWATM